jgi:hypothetical protein
MGKRWNDKPPRTRSSSSGQKRLNGAKGGRRSGAASGATAAGEGPASGGSGPLGAPDLLAGPAHGGARVVVEGSLAGSQVCSRLLLRARLRGAPVICASVLLCATPCRLTDAPPPLFQRQGGEAGSRTAAGLSQRARGGGQTRVTRPGRVPCRMCLRKAWLPPPRWAARKPFQLTFRRVLVLDACGSTFRQLSDKS